MRFLLTLLLASLLGFPATAWSQERRPLQKSDLIRLLTGGTYSKSEVAEIVRRNCLTFRPSARDRSDLRALGADSGILSALDECERRAEAPTLVLEQRSVTARAGQRVSITTTVRRGDRPEPGVRLVLRGSGGIPGGAGSDVVATTNDQGRATFPVSAGTAAGVYTLRVVGETVNLQGASVVRLRTLPGPPQRTEVTPERISLDRSGRTELRLRVRDVYGNPVPDLTLEVHGSEPDGSALARGSTDGRGEATIPLTSSDLRGHDSLRVLAGERSLAEIPLEYERPGEEGTGFVAGTEQIGEAGEALEEPLVFQVRAPGGQPLLGIPVRFRADNGRVLPQLGETDESGRVELRVTLGEPGRSTEVVGTVAGMERRVTFEPRIGGLTLAEYNTELADGGRLLSLGDHEGARRVFERLLAADSLNVDALVGYARSVELGGDPAAAQETYRTALRRAPGRLDAQLGLARSALATGQPQQAARWFEAVVQQAPDNAAAWAGLGDARAELGDRSAARAAWERALSADPSLEGIRRRLAPPGTQPLVVEVEVWGGNTFDNGRDFGPRNVEVRVWPTPRFGLFGGFDNALNLRHPYLIRGEDDIEEGYGGIELRGWGPEGRLGTEGLFARRTHPGDGTIQTIWMGEQSVQVARDVHWKVGGLLGHWFDRDDWVVFTGAEFSPAPGVRIEPKIVYGEHAGSNIVVTGRDAEREVRFMVEGEYESLGGWGIAPRVGVGSVTLAESEEFEGGVVEGEFIAWLRFARTNRFEVLIRGQSSPGDQSFTTVALGLRLGVERPRR